MHRLTNRYEGAEGEIRGTSSVGVPGYPSSGFSGSLTFANVRGCSLMVVGVPVNVPVSTL